MGLHTTVDASATTFVVTGLENGQSADGAVQAFRAVGEGRRTAALSTIPMGLPGAPVDLVAIGGPGTITLTWNPPLDEGGGGLRMYAIYRGDSPDELTLHGTIAHTQLGFMDTDLPQGRTYHYAIATINTAGEGPVGPSVSATTHHLPSVPTDLSKERDEASVDLSWGPPNLDGGSPVLSYRVYRGTDPDSLAFLDEVFDQTRYEDSSAVPDITYHYAVSAVTKVGEGPRTESLMAGPDVLLTPPWPPIALEVEVDGLTVTLIWLPPAYDGGSPVTGYVVLRGPSPDDLSEVAWLRDVLSYKDTGVEEGRTYHYCVVAVNDIGQSDPSATVLADLGGGDAVLGLSPTVWIVIATLLVLTIVVGAAYTLEPFKYSLVLLLLPLFSRYSGEQVLDNKNRYSIHGYIIDNPGINFSGICEEFDLPLGVATYHLDVLEREHYVQSVRDGRLKRFYSTDTKVPNGKMRKTPEEIRDALLVIVSEHPGISQKELIRELGIDRETVGYHIRVLVKDGFLVGSKKGRYTVYRVNNMKRRAGS
jgi:predicted transcriptional regulator